MNALDTVYCPTCKRPINPTDPICASCGSPQVAPTRRPPKNPGVQFTPATQFDLPAVPGGPPFLMVDSNATRLRNPNDSPSIRAQDIVCFILLTLFFAVGIQIVWGGIEQRMNTMALENGSQIQATVVDIRDDDTSEDGSYSYSTYLQYSYSVHGTNYLGSAYLSDGSTTKLKLGSPITILYAPARPSLSMSPEQLDAKRHEDFLRTIVAGIGVMVASVLMGRGALRARTRRRAREMHARLLPGRIVSCTGKVDSDSDFMVTCEYEFMSPYSNRCTGSRKCCRNDLKGKLLPPAGTPLSVFYVDEKDYELL